MREGVQELIRPDDSDTDDGIDHWYCCDPEMALCGTELDGFEDNDDSEPDCIVCEDLLDHPCRICGEI